MYTIMDDDGNVSMVEEPSPEFTYTYADYLGWKFKERLELFRGRIFKMASPTINHQEIAGKMYRRMGNWLENKSCKIYIAPCDVRLPIQNRKNDNEITTVVQPDLCIVCDPSKIEYRGILGAPDVVIEVLAPGNSRREMRLKYELYEEAGVKEYWVVFPAEETVLIHYLTAQGRFKDPKTFVSGDVINVKNVPGLSVDVSDIFNN